MKTIVLGLVAALIAISLTSAAARTPTNGAAAFRTLDLYNDRAQANGVTDHVNISVYPAFLSSDALIVPRNPGSTDTVALFRSRPYDAINLQVNGSTLVSSVQYAVTPHQYSTSIGLLTMAFNVFNSSGEFNDSGKLLLTLLATYEDGDTVQRAILVGNHIRDWSGGSLNCTGTRTFYTVPPSASLAGVVYSDAVNQLYYDVQEFRLPAAKRSKRLASITLSADILGHPSCFIYAGGRLHGMTTWPNFNVANASSQPVVRQSQFTNVDHGGYMFGGIPVGTRRTMNVTACQVASMAMDYTYTGFACTPTALNTYLQQNKGYEPDQVAIVTFVSPTGDPIRYTATGKTVLKVGDKFLVEHGTYTNPLATYRVTVAGRNGQATRTATHNATVPSVGDPGRVYWKMKPRVADGFTSSPQLRSIDLPDSPQLAAQVESLLVRDIAVQLNVPDHFVIASGWTSSFRPDGSARGTYAIKDPFDNRNFTKLIEGKYRNTFTMARYVVPTGALQVAGSVVAAADPPGLGILVSGARRVEVIDPLGRHMLRDASTGEGVYNIPDAVIEDVSSEHDNGGDVDDPLTGYDIEIPTTVDGHYTVNAYSDDGLALSANGYSSTGIFASDGAVDTTAGTRGNVYDVLYSGGGAVRHGHAHRHARREQSSAARSE